MYLVLPIRPEGPFKNAEPLTEYRQDQDGPVILSPCTVQFKFKYVATGMLRPTRCSLGFATRDPREQISFILKY
jgi:hypothetical protein